MIVGEYLGGRPVVSAHVVSRLIARPRSVTFFIDPASEFTLLSTGDTGLKSSDLPLDDVVALMIGFSETVGLSQRVWMSFSADDGTFHQDGSRGRADEDRG